jgi:hypothetical protein
VDEEEPQPEKKRKTKTKIITVKKEATKEDERLPSATPEVKRKDNEATRKPQPAAKPAASRTKARGNVKTQNGLMNFFGPSKKT